jgi:tetratricopeptide (TPR) repeat protein
MSKGVTRGKKAPPKATAEARAVGTEKSAAEPALSKEKQVALYEKAMKLFHAGELAKAIAAFQQVMSGPSKEVAHSARVHQAACQKRLAAREVVLPSPSDHYDYAVALINRGELDEALEHLQEALGAMKNGDHIHYALALCYGLKGEVEQAAVHLRRAIELDPRNRGVARNDPDFQPLIGRPEIRELLQTERKGSA